MRSHALAALAVSALLLAAGPRPASADERPSGVVVERLDGGPIEARRLISLANGELVVETAGTAPDPDAAATSMKVKLEDVVEIAFPTAADPERSLGRRDIAVDLWSGEVLRGTLTGGDGDHLKVDSRVLGAVVVSLDRIAGVRFLSRLAEAAEPPDLRSGTEGDRIHLAGGDQFVATIDAFGEAMFSCVTAQKQRLEFPYEKLVAVRLMAAEDQPPPAKGLRLALRDGSRVLGDGAVLADGRFKLKSASGFDVSCAATDVVAAQVVSPRFAHLSDIEAAKVEVKPVWDLVAGDPAVLYAPRKDESFSGRPLRCGGRTWLDGIGVFSGTTLTYDLGGAYRELRCHVGLDDGAGKLGGVVFKVVVDGKEVWDSGFVRAAGTQGRGKAGPIAVPAVDLSGAKTLSLVVLAGDAEDPYPVQDEADWLGAVLVRAAPSAPSAPR